MRSGYLTLTQVKFSNLLTGVNVNSFDASRRKEHESFKHFFYRFSSKAFCKKKRITKKQHFLFDLHRKGQNVT